MIYLRLQNKKRLFQGIFVGLTLGLSYEHDLWKKDSSFHLWEGIDLVTFTEERRIINARMKKETFKIQCSNLEPTLSAEKNRVRKHLDVKL